MEAVGVVAEEADLVVHAFGEAVGDPLAEESEDTGHVVAQGTREANEGTKPGAARTREPALQRVFRMTHAAAEEEEQTLLEQVGAAEGPGGWGWAKIA